VLLSYLAAGSHKLIDKARKKNKKKWGKKKAGANNASAKIEFDLLSTASL